MLAFFFPTVVEAKEGDFLQTDTLGMSLVSRDFTINKTRTVKDAGNLSEFVGLHYYVTDRVRLGMSAQVTERLWPAPVGDQSRLQRLALLPQIGWKFYDPFFAAFVFAFAPRADGRDNPTLAVEGALGVALPVSECVNVTAALEVPWTFHPHQMLGLTSLAGMSFRF